MSELNFTHSNGNKVKLTTPDTLAANKTFKLPGADGTSGQFLKTDGSGALSFATPTDTTGLAMADQWRRTATLNTNGAENFITTDWARVSGGGFGTLGTGMSESGGIFTFPSTGIYLVTWQAYAETSTTSGVNAVNIYITTDNNTYVNRASSLFSITSRAIKNPVKCCLLLLSTLTPKVSLLSVSNSSHAPLPGIIFPIKTSLSDVLSIS